MSYHSVWGFFMAQKAALLSAEGFTSAYAARSHVTVESLREQGRVAFPCNCDYEECEGWQMSTKERILEDATIRGMSFDAYVAWLAEPRKAAG